MRRTSRGRKALAVAVSGMSLWAVAAALAPGTASATTYTCSDGRLYGDGVRVEGDRVARGGITITCDGDRVVGRMEVVQS